MNKQLSSNLGVITKKQSFDYELLSTCYHEAGHTVCGLFNLIKIDWVRVATLTKIKNKVTYKLDGDTTYVEIYDPTKAIDDEFRHLILMAELRMTYAGFVAEKIYYQDISGSNSFPQILQLGSSTDIQEASSIIKKYNLCTPGKDRKKFKNSIIKEITKILEVQWDAIKLIAHMLYRYKKLSYEELANLLCKKSKYKLIWRRKFKLISKVYTTKKMISELEIKEIIKQDLALTQAEINVTY